MHDIKCCGTNPMYLVDTLSSIDVVLCTVVGSHDSECQKVRFNSKNDTFFSLQVPNQRRTVTTSDVVW